VRWFAFDNTYLSDDKIEAIGEEFGPLGPLVGVALLSRAAVIYEKGRVSGTYRDLAHDCYCDDDRDAVRAVVSRLVELGFMEQVSGDERRYDCRIVGWERWQNRKRKADQRARAAVGSSDDGDIVPTCPPVSSDVPNRTEQNRTSKATKSAATADVQAVFDAWVDATGRSQTKLTGQRRQLIQRRLADYGVDDLIDAVRGIGASAFHRGDNDRGKRYNDIELALRDAAHIERFRDEFRGQAVVKSENAFL
jgi:hypothetical protein